MIHRGSPRALILLLLLCLIVLPDFRANGQSSGITWDKPLNISNTEEQTSTDPFLIADLAGRVHLFWAEKVDVNILGDRPDTLMYAYWDGKSWSVPNDLFFAPQQGNPQLLYPTGVIDEQGVIHLIWITQPNFPYYTLNYSSVPANP